MRGGGEERWEVGVGGERRGGERKGGGGRGGEERRREEVSD